MPNYHYPYALRVTRWCRPVSIGLDQWSGLTQGYHHLGLIQYLGPWTVLLVLLLVSPPLEPDPPGSVDSKNGPRTQILTQETPIEIRRNNSSICQSYLKKEILDKNGAPDFLRNKSRNLHDTCWVQQNYAQGTCIYEVLGTYVPGTYIPAILRLSTTDRRPPEDDDHERRPAWAAVAPPNSPSAAQVTPHYRGFLSATSRDRGTAWDQPSGSPCGARGLPETRDSTHAIHARLGGNHRLSVPCRPITAVPRGFAWRTGATGGAIASVRALGHSSWLSDPPTVRSCDRQPPPASKESPACGSFLANSARSKVIRPIRGAYWGRV